MARGPPGRRRKGPAPGPLFAGDKDRLANEKCMPAVVAARQTAKPQPGAPPLIAAMSQPGPARLGGVWSGAFPGVRSVAAGPSWPSAPWLLPARKAGSCQPQRRRPQGAKGPRWRAPIGRANLERWGHKPLSQSRPAERGGQGPSRPLARCSIGNLCRRRHGPQAARPRFSPRAGQKERPARRAKGTGLRAERKRLLRAAAGHDRAQVQPISDQNTIGT